MNPRPTIGLVSLAAPWFDTAAAQSYLDATRRWARADYDVVGPSELVFDRTGVEGAIAALREAPGPVEALLLQIGTFPDGTAPARLAEATGLPVVVHSLPEPSLTHDVPLNSLCGANMSTFTLSALRHPHSFVHADPADPAGAKRLAQHLRAAVTWRRLRGQRLTLLGFRAPGFYPCVFDELLLRRRLGVAVEYLDLDAVRRRLDPAVRKPAPHQRFPTIGGGELSPEAVGWLEAHYAALDAALADGSHDLVAIRDWPELERFDPAIPGGLWPALGWVQDDGIDLAPEGDVNGAVTTRVARSLSGDLPFFTDISAWDDEATTLTLWHYGGATGLARNPAEVRFADDGRGVEFTLKPGTGHLIRIGLRDGDLRMLSVGVEILDQRVTLGRAAGLARTRTPAGEVVRHLLDDGWEHHFTLLYGELDEAIRAFAKQAGLPLTEL